MKKYWAGETKGEFEVNGSPLIVPPRPMLIFPLTHSSNGIHIVVPLSGQLEALLNWQTSML